MSLLGQFGGFTLSRQALDGANAISTLDEQTKLHLRAPWAVS